MKRPAFQFYPADWRKDPALSSCSLAARGLWIELMCIAHESDRYGYLVVNGRAMDTKHVARMVGETPASVGKLLAELEAAAVFSRDESGAIYSRRMVKDEHIREVRAQSGKLGGNPNLLKQPDKQPDKQKPTPSSSSSSSDTSQPTTPHAERPRTARAPVEGIDPEAWGAFEAHHRQLGRWTTARATAAQGQLRVLAADGADPNAVLRWATLRGLSDLSDCHRRMQADAARASPTGQGPPKSRTLSAIERLQASKLPEGNPDDPDLDAQRDPRWPEQAALPAAR